MLAKTPLPLPFLLGLVDWVEAVCLTNRHSGEEWAHNKAGQALPSRGVLTGIRGDWDFFFKQLKLPMWQENYLCWWCQQHRQDDLLGAADPLESWEFFELCRQEGRQISPLFECPLAGTGMILLDWLHLVELGIGADLCGNILWHSIRKVGVFAEGNREARLDTLNARLRAFNRVAKPLNPIGQLSLGMIKGKAEPPKLKCKGMECRGIQPFCLQLAKDMYAHHSDEFCLHMVAAADALVSCSRSVDTTPFDLAKFQELGNQFLEHVQWLNQHVAEADEGVLWRLMPKHHMFRHLLLEVAPRHGPPNLYWCWLDESLGGQFAKAALRRGGKHNPDRISVDLLQRVAALEWVK